MKPAHTNAAFVLIAACLTFLIPGNARAEGYAGQAGAFLRMGSGAVALATGDAGVARAIGAEQAHYNPAGLPYAPSNEALVGYHLLSLERSLAHVTTLFQVPSITFWSGPMRPLTLLSSNDPTQQGELAYPEQVRHRSRILWNVQDYLKPLATAILLEAEAVSSDREADSDVTAKQGQLIVIHGTPCKPGVLREVMDQFVPIVREKELQSVEEVVSLLEESWLVVRDKPAAIALNWTHAGTGDIDSRDTNGRNIGTLAYYENRFALSFGLKFHPKISGGVTVGVLYALIPDLLENESKALTSTTFSADAGIQLRPFLGARVPLPLASLVFGAAAYDLAGKNTWNTSGYWSLGTTKTDDFPARYRFGLAFDPLPGVNAYFDLETDLADMARPKGGVEYALFGGTGAGSSLLSAPSGSGGPSLALRAGIDRSRPTFGFGLTMPVAGKNRTRLDYAFIVEQVSPEHTQVVSWRFLF